MSTSSLLVFEEHQDAASDCDAFVDPVAATNSCPSHALSAALSVTARPVLGGRQLTP
jgi:hypothetical protein